MDDDTASLALAALREAGLTDDEAATFWAAERASSMVTPRDVQQAVRAWGDICAACGCVEAPELAASMIRARLSAPAAVQLLKFNLGPALTIPESAQRAIAMELLARQHYRQGAPA